MFVQVQGDPLVIRRLMGKYWEALPSLAAASQTHHTAVCFGAPVSYGGENDKSGLIVLANILKLFKKMVEEAY